MKKTFFIMLFALFTMNYATAEQTLQQDKQNLQQPESFIFTDNNASDMTIVPDTIMRTDHDKLVPVVIDIVTITINAPDAEINYHYHADCPTTLNQIDKAKAKIMNAMTNPFG